MFPFWELAVAPLLEACECRRVVEIGALRGENTVQMLDRLGPGTELHVIDPAPDFDPAEHEARFGGRYVFHGDLSLNVLPHLPPMDAALIDGDHNWYTVYHELGALTKVARDAGAPLPLMILHDVLWPYGRRDLYYGPDTIPEEFRQPHDQRGMSPDKKRLLNAGGMNAQLHNAVEEGGPRNGVMTGLEDWMAEHDKPLRRVVLPIYFGLAIVVEEERLARQPQLAAVLDHLESAAGRGQLLELSEDIRLRAAVFQQSVFAMRERQVDAGAHRYLNLLKGALLDEHYIENELRIQQLVRHLEEGSRPSPIQMADPLRLLRRDAEVLTALRHAGRLRDESDQLVSYFPWTTMGRVRIDHLEQALDLVRTGNVPGDLVECGTGRGGGAIFLRGYLEAYFLARPTVWVVDAFRGSPRSDTGAPLNDDRELPVPGGGAGFPLLQADLNMVRDGFARFDLLDDRVRFVEGDLDQTLPSAPIDQIALLRIGDDLGQAVGDVLDRLYDKLAIGGVVVIDDYVDDACRQAVDDFRARRRIPEPLEHVDWAGAWWRKLAEPGVPAGAETGDSATDATDAPIRSSRAVGAPLLEPVPVGQLDLSVVVVFYNMRREAQRTLHSLSRSYQEGIEGLDYEVIVVENGSDPDQRVDEELVRSFGPQFRFIDMGPDAPPSPVFALNRGSGRDLGQGRGHHDRRRPRADAGRAALGPGRHRPLRARGGHHPAVVPGSGPATRHDRRRLRPGLRGRAATPDLLAQQRLPPVRDRPLHRRARLVRRRVGEQLPVRAPQAARAGGHLRRELRGARRWLRQPGALRTPRRHPGRDRGVHPGRGFVPPAARRDHHQRGGRPGATRPDQLLLPPVRGHARAGVPRAQQEDPLRGDHVLRGVPYPFASHHGRAVLQEMGSRRSRWPAQDRRAHRRGSQAGLHRGLLAQPRLAQDRLAGPATQPSLRATC